MAPATDLGASVWVDCGKIDHPAFLVTSEPPIVENGIQQICVYWPVHGYREYVEESRIKIDIGSRRKPAPPVGPQTRTRNPDPKIKQEDEDKKPAAKSKRQRNQKKGTDIVHVCAPGPWAYEIIKRAKEPKLLEHRLPEIDDVGYIGNELYVVKGFSAFYNRFEHFPNLLEVKHHWTAARRYVWTDASTLNPQDGQMMPPIVRNHEDDTESDRIMPEVVGSHGAVRLSTTAPTTPDQDGGSHENTTALADLANRLKARAKRGGKTDNRELTDGDLVTYQGRTYLAVGSSMFYGRFAHIPSQLDLQCTNRRERTYVPEKALKAVSGSMGL